MDNITETSIYKEATTRPATSLSSAPRVKQTIQEISKSLDEMVDRESSEYASHKLGRMYHNNISRNATSTDILAQFLNCYYELVYKELDYNNNIEKIDIVKKSIKTMHNTLDILKQLELQCDGDKMIALMRAFCV